MDQRWMDAVFLHWRIPEAVSASFMPPGVAPDVFDGSAWVGLIGFRMQRAGLGPGPGVPYFGSFNEINVRLYSRESDGTRGVVFRSLDASRLAVVLAARAAGIPYVWSRTSFLSAASLDSTGRTAGAGSAGADGAGGAGSAAGSVGTGGFGSTAGAGSGGAAEAGATAGAGGSGAATGAGGTAGAGGSGAATGAGGSGRTAGYSVRRFRGGARSDFAVVPELDAAAVDPLSIHLTARFGLHSRFRGRTLYIPNAHSAWPLYRADLTLLQDELVGAAGIQVAGPPESVLFSPGVRTQFGRPRVLNNAA
ncbi:DUF2071 domain-containing protein [Arthrobacter sp. ES3-54]|uniref:DUF2071 domain-containing protein n=1 Tax=Arthrobacter sp. ES3-54 TaxID=1502991 RepID=UPI0024068D61|nr:DUF2071 domain-containing protein [Arthrobacter sp. ES3-54]MDF9751654.1 uncharacterized protein YqjF (DUF2071 family) [Arthrobacter sp. ES3-54]